MKQKHENMSASQIKLYANIVLFVAFLLANVPPGNRHSHPRVGQHSFYRADSSSHSFGLDVGGERHQTTDQAGAWRGSIQLHLGSADLQHDGIRTFYRFCHLGSRATGAGHLFNYRSILVGHASFVS